MPLSSENQEKLKLTAKAALIAAAGATAVKYFRQEGRPTAYIYPLNGRKHKGFIAGIIDEATGQVTQFAGEITSRNFWPHLSRNEVKMTIYDHGQTDDEVARLAQAFGVHEDDHPAA